MKVWLRFVLIGGAMMILGVLLAIAGPGGGGEGLTPPGPSERTILWARFILVIGVVSLLGGIATLFATAGRDRGGKPQATSN